MQERPPPAPGAPAHVVLITIAGLSPADYRDAPRGGTRMSRLAERARGGVSADEVAPVVPATAYPAHATLITGETSDRHGIVGDHLLGKRGVRAALYWHASRLRGNSLWAVSRAAGLSVVALGWPSTLGAAIDLLLPDVVPTRPGETWLGLLADSTTPWLRERIERAAPKTPDAHWPRPDQRDALLVDLACEVAASDSPPALWLVRLTQTAAALTGSGPDSREADAAFGRVDEELERLVACFARAGLVDRTAFIVTGDRGVAPVHTQVNPNAALARAGLIARDPPSTTAIRDWTAIAQSHGGSAFVYARGEASALEARDALEDAAQRTRAFRVVSAAELQALRGDPQAWFGLAAEPGYVFGSGIGVAFLRAAPVRGAGGYLPEPGAGGIGFVAWGRGLRGGIRVPRMRQVDVAPSLAALLGVSLGSVEGRPLVGILAMEEPR